MNLKDMLDVSPEVRDAVRFGHAVVALSTTALAHSIPAPHRAAFASDTEAAVRGGGAVPAWTAVLDGVLHVGLSPAQLGRICREPMAKITRRDLPAAAALHQTGATSASAALVLASLAGIRFFAAGGIGGVRGADVSSDLRELCRTPVAVVCSGVKLAKNASATLEYLETEGIPVVGMGTREFPAYLCRTSGLALDCSVEREADAARIAKACWDLGFGGGVLLANPAPEHACLEPDEADRVLGEALGQAQTQNVCGKRLTPFLLAQAAQLTDGRALDAAQALLLNNARCAARIAHEYARL